MALGQHIARLWRGQGSASVPDPLNWVLIAGRGGFPGRLDSGATGQPRQSGQGVEGGLSHRGRVRSWGSARDARVGGNEANRLGCLRLSAVVALHESGAIVAPDPAQVVAGRPSAARRVLWLVAIDRPLPVE